MCVKKNRVICPQWTRLTTGGGRLAVLRQIVGPLLLAQAPLEQYTLAGRRKADPHIRQLVHQLGRLQVGEASTANPRLLLDTLTRRTVVPLLFRSLVHPATAGVNTILTPVAYGRLLVRWRRSAAAATTATASGAVVPRRRLHWWRHWSNLVTSGTAAVREAPQVIALLVAMVATAASGAKRRAILAIVRCRLLFLRVMGAITPVFGVLPLRNLIRKLVAWHNVPLVLLSLLTSVGIGRQLLLAVLMQILLVIVVVVLVDIGILVVLICIGGKVNSAAGLAVVTRGVG